MAKKKIMIALADEVNEKHIYYQCRVCGKTHRHGTAGRKYPRNSIVIENRTSHCLNDRHEVRIIVSPSVVLQK